MRAPDLGIDWRPAGPAVWVGPLPTDQLAVPSEQRLRRDQEHRPALTRESARQGGQHRTVERTEPRASDLPSQDLELVAQDQDLEVLRPISPRSSPPPGGRRRNTQKTIQLSTAGAWYRCPGQEANRGSGTLQAGVPRLMASNGAEALDILPGQPEGCQYSDSSGGDLVFMDEP
jgi:hypothetical protein